MQKILQKLDELKPSIGCGVVDTVKEVIMKNTVPIKMKVIDSSMPDMDYIYTDEIKKIQKCTNKNGEKYLIVSYYDDEFCLDCALVCRALVIDASVI